jgi:general secretion pathway protein B
MSYILDALNKSEQQRGDSAQSAIVAPVNPAPPAKRRLALPAILLTAALLAAWGIVQINRDEQQSSSGPTSQIAMAPSSISPQPKTAPTSPHQRPVQALPVAPVQPTTPATTRRPLAETEPLGTRARPEPIQAAVQSDVAVPVFKPITPTSSVSRMAAPSLDVPNLDLPNPDVPNNKTQPAQAETDILAISELPLSVQQALPAIHIDGHIYDDNPVKRMVIINGATYREKQQIAGGLKLEEITPNGVILSYQGYVFHLGVFE